LSEAAFRRLLFPLVRFLARVGIHPDMLTVAGWVLSVVSALFFGLGHIQIAGAVMLVGGVFDALDGAVARESNRMSRFGAFLDSTLDRFSESAIFAGIVFFFASSASPWAALLAAFAMTFSLLTSYARARAEGLGVECKVGILERAGRVTILSIFSILGFLTIGLALVGAGAAVTTAQRILHVARTSRT
jgi:CDP-diacylglycerol---glycerol-3-phosphate 3-phosphatidyltransferase